MKINVRITKQQNADYYNVAISDVVNIQLDEYLKGVVASQIGNANVQACKAQAIACRTCAYPYYSANKIISDSSSKVQCFNAVRAHSDQYPNAFKAVDLTENMLVCYNNTPCSPCSYCNSNGGHTKSSKQVWGGQRAWLISQEDPWDTGNGKSHCVGMSQNGAKALAKAGKTYEQILAFYYPGTSVKKFGDDTMSTTTTKKTSVTATQFVQMAKYIHDKYKITYSWGSSGQQIGTNSYKSDCRGYILFALRKLGVSYSSIGTNYMSRQQMRQIFDITDVNKLQPGMVVFKYYNTNDAKYDLQAKYKKSGALYNQFIGIRDVYHVGIVVSTNPLKIYHCGSNPIRVDTAIGNWRLAGWLKVVKQTQTTQTDTAATTVAQETTTVQTVAQTTQSKQKIGIVNCVGKLNLRKGAGTSYARICYINSGQKVTILKQNCGVSGWYYVKYGKYNGYVMSKFIKTS